MEVPQTLIALATGAETDVKEAKIIQDQVPATLIARGLAGVEVVPVLFSTDNGATFENVFEGGSQVTLTATNKTFTINSPIHIGVTKPTTAGNAGVFLAVGNKA